MVVNKIFCKQALFSEALTPLVIKIVCHYKRTMFLFNVLQEVILPNCLVFPRQKKKKKKMYAYFVIIDYCFVCNQKTVMFVLA